MQEMPRLRFPEGSLLAAMLGEHAPIDLRRAARRLRAEGAPALAIDDGIAGLASGLAFSGVSRSPAVLDVLPSDTPEAVDLLRARLAAARFPAIFAGHLPVVHLRLAPRQMPMLPALLDDAFAARPPLRLLAHERIDEDVLRLRYVPA